MNIELDKAEPVQQLSITIDEAIKSAYKAGIIMGTETTSIFAGIEVELDRDTLNKLAEAYLESISNLPDWKKE